MMISPNTQRALLKVRSPRSRRANTSDISFSPGVGAQLKSGTPVARSRLYLYPAFGHAFPETETRRPRLPFRILKYRRGCMASKCQTRMMPQQPKVRRLSRRDPSQHVHNAAASCMLPRFRVRASVDECSYAMPKRKKADGFRITWIRYG